MRKKRKELYAAHRDELKKEVMTAEKHYEEINLFGQAVEDLEETKDGPSEKKDLNDFQNFVDLLSRSELEEILRLLIPIIKLRTNLYLVGTKQRQIFVKNTNLLIRVGGGYMDLNEYLGQQSKSECLAISNKMEK